MRHLGRLPVAFCIALLALVGQTLHAQSLETRTSLLEAARSIVNEAEYATLITVGQEGYPRARTVRTSLPGEDLTVWVATRPQSRKVGQISDDPKVQLHYIADDFKSYVSIMGVAYLHTDEESIRKHDFFPTELRNKLWPGFPKDYMLIEIHPVWVEVLGRGVTPDPYTWQPQGVCLDMERCPYKNAVEQN